MQRRVILSHNGIRVQILGLELDDSSATVAVLPDPDQSTIR